MKILCLLTKLSRKVVPTTKARYQCEVCCCLKRILPKNHSGKTDGAEVEKRIVEEVKVQMLIGKS
jgi:hypothetical protein